MMPHSVFVFVLFSDDWKALADFIFFDKPLPDPKTFYQKPWPDIPLHYSWKAPR